MTTTTDAANKMNDVTRNQLMRQFEAELSRQRFELLNQLGTTNVLNRSQRDHTGNAFCQRLEVMQFDFQKVVEHYRNFDADHPNRPEMDSHLNLSSLAALCAAAGGGMAAAHASQIIVWDTLNKGFWLWKTTSEVSLAAKIAALLGISTAHSIVVIAVLGGIPLYFISKKLTDPLVAGWLRKVIVAQYDKTIAPQLRDWARKQVYDS